jgi:hypothetical protein
MEKDDREGLVRQYLEMLLTENWNELSMYERRNFVDEHDPDNPKGTIIRETVCALEIWCECFRKRREDFMPKESNTINAIMSQIDGWERQPKPKHHKHYGTQRFYGKI